MRILTMRTQNQITKRKLVASLAFRGSFTQLFAHERMSGSGCSHQRSTRIHQPLAVCRHVYEEGKAICWGHRHSGVTPTRPVYKSS